MSFIVRSNVLSISVQWHLWVQSSKLRVYSASARVSTKLHHLKFVRVEKAGEDFEEGAAPALPEKRPLKQV